MNTPSWRDIEQLSAYLDGQLSQSQKTRLIARIVKEPALAQAMEELRQTRNLLRETPQRRSPRKFTLTPRMAGIRPPVPRVVPALSWASAAAVLLFIITFGYNLLPLGGFGAAAPRAADSYASGRGGGPPAATSAPATQPPVFPAPATQAPATMPPATEPPTPPHQATKVAIVGPTPTPAIGGAQPTQGGTPGAPTETPEIITVLVPQPTPQPESGIGPSTTTQKQPQQGLPWAYIWLGLAVVLVGAALLIRWVNDLAFKRSSSKK